MKQKDYRKPTMRVVELHHTGMLMDSIYQTSNSVQNYTWHNDVEEE